MAKKALLTLAERLFGTHESERTFYVRSGLLLLCVLINMGAMLALEKGSFWYIVCATLCITANIPLSGRLWLTLFYGVSHRKS